MIFFFDQYPYIGGGQRILLDVTEAMCDTPQAFCIPAGGPLENALRGRFPDAAIFDAAPPDITHRRKGLADALRLLAYTIGGVLRHGMAATRAKCLYANGGRQFPLVMILSLLNGTPAVYHLHLDHSGTEKRLIALAARLRTTKRIIAISEFVRARFATALPASSAGKLILIENALSAELASRAFRERFAGAPLRHIAIAGTIRPEKGQDQAIQVARAHPDLQLHVLGAVGLGAEKWASDLQLSAPANVTFHGPVPDVGAAFDRLGIQLSLVPSQWQEPFGLIAIESMASSCITLVQDSGALAGIAAHTGAILCQDTPAMIREVGRLKNMSGMALSTIANGQFNAAQERYAPDRFADEIRAVLKPLS